MLRRQTIISLARIHALVLDDQAGSRASIHRALRTMGVMHVTELVTNESSNSRPSTRDVDVVVSDVGLALGNGLALLKAIRLARVPGVRADVPFIFVSAPAYPAMISAAAKLDVSGFVVKPLQTERLRNVILNALARRVALAPEKYEKVDVFDAMRVPEIHRQRFLH